MRVSGFLRLARPVRAAMLPYANSALSNHSSAAVGAARKLNTRLAGPFKVKRRMGGAMITPALACQSSRR
jgi:hypothetical protein